MKQETTASCNQLKAATEAAAAKLKQDTEAEAAKLKQDTEAECEQLKAKTREEVYMTRSQVKRECESISEFVAQLMASVDKVSTACQETKKLTDDAFGDVASSKQ